MKHFLSGAPTVLEPAPSADDPAARQTNVLAVKIKGASVGDAWILRGLRDASLPCDSVRKVSAKLEFDPGLVDQSRAAAAPL